MAEFNSVTMTRNGLRLIELSQGMGKPLTFTKIMIGDGTPGTGEDITAYTALKNPKLTASITNIKPITSTSAEARWAVYGAYSNSILSAGFYIKEAGLYAKVAASNYDDKGWAGYAGEEFLIGYVSAKDGKADWLPAASIAQETQEIVFYSSVGNASSVTAYVPEESFVRHDELEEMVQNLYIKLGDVIKIPTAFQGAALRTGGFLTNAAKDIYFTIPLNRPINARKVTISNAVLSVRQNGYVFGTGAESTPVPSTAQINATISANTFICVVIQFASALPGTNNSPVGITFSGTLTFA